MTIKGGPGSGRRGHRTYRPTQPKKPKQPSKSPAELHSDLIRHQGLLDEPEVSHVTSRYANENYRRINGDLRSTPYEDISPKVRRHIEVLDDAIESSEVHQPIVTYRGVNQFGSRGLANLPEGSTFSDKAFQSTSLSKGIADKRAGQGGIILAFHMPKGSQGLAIRGMNLQGEDEHEVLLPRNQSFRVIKKEGNIMHVEPVKEEGKSATKPLTGDVGHDISELVAAGHPHDQAVAIALNNKGGKKMVEKYMKSLQALKSRRHQEEEK